MYNGIVPVPLAKVFDDDELTGPRGPDGRHEIVVTEDWMLGRAWIEIPLPRLLSCASCDGGGCDGCERSGAVATRPRKTPPEVIEVQLPGAAPVVLRLPRYGGLAPDENTARGLLLLAIRLGPEPSEGLRLVDLPPAPQPLAPPPAPPRPLVLLWVAAAVMVALLIWLLLRG